MYHLKMVHTNRNMSWSVIKFDTKANYCFDCIINKRCVVGPLRLYHSNISSTATESTLQMKELWQYPKVVQYQPKGKICFGRLREEMKMYCFCNTYNKPTRFNAGGEDGSSCFYHSAHIVILERLDAAAFVRTVIQNGDPTAIPQRYIHSVTGLSTWGWEHTLWNRVASDVLLKHLPARN
jgi:hypothetical protein